jgi:predicted DNA repair protein MutK
VPVVHHWIESVGAAAGVGGFIVPVLLNGVAGIVAGALVLVGVKVASKIWRSVKS